MEKAVMRWKFLEVLPKNVIKAVLFSILKYRDEHTRDKVENRPTISPCKSYGLIGYNIKYELFKQGTFLKPKQVKVVHVIKTTNIA